MIFWLIAAAIAACAAWVLLAPLRTPARVAAPAESADMRIYRDQLAEVDRDLARGTLDEGEAARLRIEVQRRLLDADRTHTERGCCWARAHQRSQGADDCVAAGAGRRRAGALRNTRSAGGARFLDAGQAGNGRADERGPPLAS